MNRKLAISSVVTATALAAMTLGATTASAATNHSAQDEDVAHYTSGPAFGTGGLIIRDIHGRDLGSGIGEMQDFIFESCGPRGSGLIEVTQLRRGSGGGWGNLYRGYVRKAYTQVPSMFPCND